MHEAYIRLVDANQAFQQWNSRGHFFGAAAEAIRRILVENARWRARGKHGGGRRREELAPSQIVAPEVSEDLLALDEALERLTEKDPQSAELVKLRYFAGLTIPQAAEILGVSPRKADFLWSFARAWLRRDMEELSPVQSVGRGEQNIDFLCASWRDSSHCPMEAHAVTHARWPSCANANIFIEALEKGDPSERAALLDEACQTDAKLRERVERLLSEHERQESFILDTPPTGLHAPGDQPLSETPGTVIGPYKLLQQIGEGGMGTVFMAEQTHPVQRKVALKIIKPGMDSREVIARFEAERQALAMMDHVNIASVLDAGSTESGRPYFVMELVNGVPITKYCDDNHLTTARAAGIVRAGLPCDPARPPEGHYPPRH